MRQRVQSNNYSPASGIRHRAWSDRDVLRKLTPAGASSTFFNTAALAGPAGLDAARRAVFDGSEQGSSALEQLNQLEMQNQLYRDFFAKYQRHMIEQQASAAMEPPPLTMMKRSTSTSGASDAAGRGWSRCSKKRSRRNLRHQPRRNATRAHCLALGGSGSRATPPPPAPSRRRNEGEMLSSCEAWSGDRAAPGVRHFE